MITSVPVGPLAANCYVIAAPDATECVVIDTGQLATKPLGELLATHGLTPAAVLITHGHFDHVASAPQVCQTYAVDVYIGAGDVPMLTGQYTAMPEWIRDAIGPMLEPGEDLDKLRPARLTPLGGGEMLRIAGLTITAIAIPGHTPGSMAYLLERGSGEPAVVFTGDTLFAGSIGRTDLPGGSSAQIHTSISGQLLTLPDDTIVAPGHGPSTTIGAERAENPFLGGR